ncbi:hypothetical protein Salat_0297500 [Sesamum alatum]|uniref:Uncharacterized protein n=1 Tax=Sesamum alatum TaxID=300844 RepID=A0AAE2CYT2_9LAMI|nr:hypothetical protein Salat_0297500 [Sesamum alatum]
MHAKHRNGPGNGYRSNAMGMGGVAASSRISPESSMRGRMYNSEYRNYNRGGYGRGGRSRHFQPTLPPRREADIFVEAGRLAAEYLVSKGVLPPNALSGKWQIDGLKNQVGNFQGFRPQEVEKTQIPADGRASAHSRLGNATLDVGPGRRRYSDEYNSMDSRSSLRGRKRSGSFKDYGSEVNKELGRSGSWAEKSKVSPGKEVDSDASVGHHDEQPAGKDGRGVLQNPSPGEITQEVDTEGHIESGLEKRNLGEDADGSDSTLSNEKYLPSDADGEPITKYDNASNDEAKLVKIEGNNDNELHQKRDEDKEVNASVKEDNFVSQDHVDLVKHCKFFNVPTKARSSLTVKGSKGDQDPKNEDENNSKRELLEGTGVRVMDPDIGSSAGTASLHQNHEFRSLQSDILNAPAVEKELDVTYTTRPGQCLRSGSFPERSGYKETETEPDEKLSDFGSSNSLLMERGEKRAIDHNTDDREDFKKLKQWVPHLAAQSDSSPPLSSSMENRPMLEEPRTSKSAQVAISPDQKSLDISLFSKGHADSCEFMEEKQLFPGSFDLNLVGTCDVNENHDGDHMIVFPSVTQTGKVATPIDVDLSMGNNGNLPNKNGKHAVNDNDIEIIDLEKDTGPEDKTVNNPERRGDVFTDLDGFPNNVHNANGIPDVQDGYGLMISELLGNDIPNCSSVPTDLNSLHNHMGLPNAEGILGDDDSIYMSLGEIPISLLGAWEQPNQDYGKPF